MKQLTLIRQNILLSERRSERHPHLNLPSRERKLDHFAASDSLTSFSIFPGRAPNTSCCLREGRKNVGLRLKIGQKAVLAILVFLWMVLPVVGSTAEHKSDLRITYTPPSISVEAQGVRLLEMLRNISLKVGFDLADYGVPDRYLTVSIQEATVEEVLRQLLRGENYGVVHREKDGTISKVLLLSSSVYAQAAPISEKQQTRPEAMRSQEGLTIFSAAPSYKPPRSEQKNKGDSEPRVEDILRVHAISGLAGSDMSLQSLPPNVSQPLGNSTPAFLPHRSRVLQYTITRGYER
jgi:hypothetical protein